MSAAEAERAEAYRARKDALDAAVRVARKNQWGPDSQAKIAATARTFHSFLVGKDD